MTKRAYVQTVAGKYSDSGSCAAAEGLVRLGYEVIPFSASELTNGDLELSKDSPVNAGIEVMQLVFKQLGMDLPPALDYPESIKHHLGRKMERKVFGDIRAMENFDTPVFAKSVAHKVFNGHLFQGKRADNLIQFVHIKDQEPVWVCEPVKFISEWRVYVLRGEVVGIGHYGFGDQLVFPDRNEIYAMIKDYENPPASYGLDVGISQGEWNRDTLLVEVNDSLSLGNYGCRPKPYAQMIEARWNELMGV